MSTDTTLLDLLECWEAEKSAERDPTRLSPSDADPLCGRALAYRINATTPTDDVDTVHVGTVGSLIDVGVMAQWRAESDENVVQGCRPDPMAVGGEARVYRGPGTPDVIRPAHREVRDLKSLSRAKFDRWEALDGPPDNVWVQPEQYAAAWIDQEDTDPAGWTLLIDAICRETGRCATYHRPYDPEHTGELGATLQAVRDSLEGRDPDTVPADRPGRGDWVCDGCPWQTRCLGNDDRPAVIPEGLQPAELADSATQYRYWNAIKLDADRKAKAARNRLRGADGTFGGFKVWWTIGQPTFVQASTRAGAERLNVKPEKP